MSRGTVKLSLSSSALAFHREQADRREVPLATYLATLLQELALAGTTLATSAPSLLHAPPVAEPSPEKAQRSYKGPRPTASGYKGVYAYGRNWAACIRVDGSLKRVGVFADAYEAARVYDAAAREQYGATAEVNFPASDHNLSATSTRVDVGVEDTTAETCSSVRAAQAVFLQPGAHQLNRGDALTDADPFPLVDDPHPTCLASRETSS